MVKGLIYDLKKKTSYFQSWKKSSIWIVNWPTIFILSNSYINNKWKKFTGKWLYSSVVVKLRLNEELHYFCVPYDMINEGPDFLRNGERYLQRFHSFFPDLTLEDGLIVDIGAHVGSFSLPLVWKNKGIKVIAAEPSPENVSILSKNIQLNQLQGRFSLYPVAVYDKKTEVDFGTGKRSTIGSVVEVGSYKLYHGKKSPFGSGKKVTVPAITLAELLKNADFNFKMLKMDCEGSEYRIFDQARELIGKFQYLLIEAHPSNSGTPDGLKELITQMGYRIFSDDLGNGCFEYFCEKIRPA